VSSDSYEPCLDVVLDMVALYLVSIKLLAIVK